MASRLPKTAFSNDSNTMSHRLPVRRELYHSQDTAPLESVRKKHVCQLLKGGAGLDPPRLRLWRLASQLQMHHNGVSERLSGHRNIILWMFNDIVVS